MVFGDQDAGVEPLSTNLKNCQECRHFNHSCSDSILLLHFQTLSEESIIESKWRKRKRKKPDNRKIVVAHHNARGGHRENRPWAFGTQLLTPAPVYRATLPGPAHH
jgi:hypothetical protein